MSSLVHVAETLKKTQLFGSLSEPELEYLRSRVVVRHFAPADTIFVDGDPCTGLYIVEVGHVRIFKSSAGGREHVLSIDGPGSSVAELPVFDGGTYPASAAALDAVTLLFLSKEDFQGLCLAHPQVALRVLRMVGGRLRRLVGIIEELSFTTVRHRLAAFLLREAQKQQNTPDAATLLLPSSNQEMAAHLGTVRELVSRNLSRLQAEGLIRVDGRQVTILSKKGLRAAAEAES